MNWKLSIAGGFAFFSLAASAAAQPCQTDRFKDLVCGDGRDAVRVFEETMSPSKRYAIGWRMKRGKPLLAEHPDTEDVENVLIRLSDGAVLAVLGGNRWTRAGYRANQYDTDAVWSADERAVIESASQRWDTYALTYVTIANGDKAATADLLPLVLSAAKATLPKKARDDYVLRVRHDRPALFEKGSRLRVGTVLYVPRGESDRWLDLTLRISEKGGVPKASVVGVTKGARKER